MIIEVSFFLIFYVISVFSPLALSLSPHSLSHTAPESVGEVTALALSPEEVRVSFLAQAEESYEVHWRRGGVTAGPLRPPSPHTTQKIQVNITHLLPNTKYEVSGHVSQDSM